MNLSKFRKSDQYYEDEYDRLTISAMKGKEAFWKDKLNLISDNDILFKEQLAAHIDIHEYGTHFAKNKRPAIQDWIAADERKDQLIARHPIPSPPYCSKCDDHMKFFDYDFINKDYGVQFLFSCGPGTKHNAILEANGNRLFAPEQYCPYCNSQIKTKVKKTKSKITVTDSCIICSWSSTTDFDVKSKQKLLIPPIQEEERKAYCTNFKNSRDFLEELQVLGSIFTDEDLKYDVSKINILKVADLDKIIGDALQAKQFAKIQFEPPKISGYITIRFSILDTSERTEQQSIKTLKKAISEVLLLTNWRLMTTDISYRLGYLTGQLKGVDQKEDLQKVAAEIDSLTGSSVKPVIT